MKPKQCLKKITICFKKNRNSRYWEKYKLSSH